MPPGFLCRDKRVLIRPYVIGCSTFDTRKGPNVNGDPIILPVLLYAPEAMQKARLRGEPISLGRYQNKKNLHLGFEPKSHTNKSRISNRPTVRMCTNHCTNED